MMTICHAEGKIANTYAVAHHRHYKAARRHRFSLDCYVNDLYEIIRKRREEL